jgi:hypothetical protein
LDAISDPERRRALRDGDWDILAGAAFGEWNRDRHVVEPFDIPKEWARRAGIDYGFRVWAVAWLAIDNDQRVFFYREVWRSQVPERDQAKMILALEQAAGEVGVYRALDPSAWGQDGSALPPAIQYLLEGCAVEKAANDRLSGVSRFHTYLADGPACAHHRAMGWTTCPMLHVFSTLTNWIRTVPALVRDPQKPEDVLKSNIDHLYDASRYGLMSIGGAGGPVLYDDVDEPRRLSVEELGGPAPQPMILGSPYAGDMRSGLSELGVSFEREDGTKPGTTARSPFA